MLCFAVAKELGMGLTTLLATEPREVILGWSAFFEIKHDDVKKITGTG
jgi:hypothetical protein